MKLYHTPKAVSPERTYNFLKAKGQLDTVELVEVSIMKGEHKTPEYKALSPFSQLPVLVLDDGTKITETRAICTYFEGLFPDPNLMGSTPKEKALIEMWDRRIEFMFLVQFAQWFRNGNPMMAALENPQVPGAAEKGERNAKWFAKKLNAHLSEAEWLAADRFSIADITLYLTTGFCAAMRWNIREEHDQIARHYNAVKARLG